MTGKSFRKSRNAQKHKRHPFTTTTFLNVKKKKRSIKVLEPFKCIENSLLEPYKCNRCKRQYHLLIHLKNHRNCTSSSTPNNHRKIVPIHYVCDGCEFKTFSRLLLFKHIYSNQCKITQGKMPLMLMGLKDKSGERKIKLYSSQEILPKTLYHIQKEAVELFKCDLCPFKTKHIKWLKGHKLTRHTSPEDECEFCPYVGKSETDLEKHTIVRHQKHLMVKCKQCNQKFWCKEALEEHNDRKHSVEWFECGLCPHRTRYKSHFRRHIREQHATDEAQSWLLCEYCGYKAKQNVHLKLHLIQRHTANEDIDWHKCGECDYKAKLKASLKEHSLRKHNSDNIKWFECEQCSYRTFKRYILKTHVKKNH